MKKSVLALASTLLLSTLCCAQNLVPSADTDDAGSVAAAAQVSRSRVQGEENKQADIRKLLQVTGAGNLANQTMAQMEKSMKPLITNALPPGDYREKLVDLFFEKFHAKMDPTTLADLIVPVYDKYLSDEDVKALIQLYQTPIGQKLVTVLPQVAAESQAAGEKWGQEIGRECMIEVLAEHPELQKQMEEAKKNASEQQ